MDYVISYEVMSIVILALILVSYTCHKWLDIKRNRTFNLLVIMTICTVIVDLIGRSCVYVVGSNALFMATVVATVVNLSLYQVCLLFYKYTLNTLGCANVFYQGISAVFLVFDLLVDIALLSNPWTHFFFEYNIANFKSGYSLRTTLSIGGKIVGQETILLTRNNHTFSIDASNDYTGFKIHWWDLKCQNLYDIDYELIDENNVVVDHVSSYAGFRIFKTDGSLLMLNLNPIYLKMVLEQGYFRNSGLTFESEEQIIHEIELIRQLGFNGVRLHQKIEDERFYYYCDIIGLMVFLEMPSAYEFKDVTIEHISKEWMEAIKQNYNHPSIICWVPINESWGVNRLTSNVNEASFTEALYYLTKSYDAMRPVIANDGWEHTCSDIITFHNYEQNASELEKFYQNISGVLNKENRTNYSNLRRPFVGNHTYRGQPILIDEFMGIGFENKNDKGWGYGDKVVNQEQFIHRIHDLSKAVQSIHEINGFCITQITDVYQEINGLYDFDRKEKAPIEDIKKAIEGK